MKISIITATYNSGQTLRNTLDSVLAQTYTDYELIIQDGGSQDDTLAIAGEYRDRFGDKLRIFSAPDKGLYDGINKGIRAATGDIVGILNSDDFFTGNTVLKRIAEAFSLHPETDAVYGDIHFVRPENLHKCVRYYSSRHFRPWKLRIGYMPAHPSFYCRREVYERHGLYSLDFKIASDYEMMVRLFQKARIRSLYLPMDFVTMRTGGISTRSFKNRLKITAEDAKACRANGFYSNFLLCSIKYFSKLFEFKL